MKLPANIAWYFKEESPQLYLSRKLDGIRVRFYTSGGEVRKCLAIYAHTHT
jgi:hypothetical protein